MSKDRQVILQWGNSVNYVTAGCYKGAMHHSWSEV